jgi:AcrR family transcriptional regulator
MATDETREKLLKAATEVFVETGFSGARVDEIARKAGANKAMIYYHFGDKAALYQAVLLRLMGPVHEHIDALDGERDPRRRLRAFYRGLVERFHARPALPKLMLREVLAGGRNMEAETARAFARILAFVAATLEEGEAAGRFPATSPLLFHLAVLAPALLLFAGGDFRARVTSAAASSLPTPKLEALLKHVDAAIERGLVTPKRRRS